MLIDRLIFGTARLTGGADRAHAEALLRQAIDGGIRHIDTAPTYGVGTAEQVVGTLLSERDDVRVTAKVGLPHPRLATAKTWARKIKRAVRPPAVPLDGGFVPIAEPVATNRQFDVATLAQSFAVSRARLGRETVDMLLLHEGHAATATPAVIEWLEEQRRSGLAGAIGYSHGSIPGALADAAFPEPWVVQGSADPAWLRPAEPASAAPTRPLVVHSVALTADWLSRHDPASGAALSRAAALLSPSGAAGSVALVVAAIAVLARRLPEARFIVATTDPRRLADYLAAIGEVEAIGIGALAASFDATSQP